MTTTELLNLTDDQKRDGIWISGGDGTGEFMQWSDDLSQVDFHAHVKLWHPIKIIKAKKVYIGSHYGAPIYINTLPNGFHIPNEDLEVLELRKSPGFVYNSNFT